MRRLSIAVLSLLAAAPLSAGFKSTWPFDGRFAVVNSQVPDRSVEDNLKSSGVDLDLHFNPILGWTQSRFLILPALDIETSSANTILKVDDERFEFLQQTTTNLELGLAFKQSADQRFTFKAFGGGFQAKQAVNEELTTGQYNYQDGGVQFDWRRKWSTNTPFRTTLGLKATDRKYPNWLSLDPSARHEKDQSITKLFTDLEWSWTSMEASTYAGLSIQNVNYPESVIVDETGTTANALKRQESVIELSLSNPMQFGANGWDPRLRGTMWISNLSVYDSQNNYYMPHYNSFYEINGGLGYSRDFKGPWMWGAFDSPQLTLDLDLGVRQYFGRPARATDGSITDVAERDFTRNVGLGFNSAISEHWAFYSKFNHQASASNNEDQSSALYNYVFNTFSLGVNFAY